MTKTSQDFTVNAGDAGILIFTVQDQNGNPLNIGTIAEIVWSMRKDFQASSPIVLTKKMSTGGITFINGGATGQFQVVLATGDTASFTGFYFHTAYLVDGLGNQSTIELGRAKIGPQPLWTYTGDPTTSPKDAVRFNIGDTLEADQLVQDQEIFYALSTAGSVYGACAICCRSLASQFARLVDTVQGQLRTTYSSKSRQFRTMANEFEIKAMARGPGLAYAGGISVQDKLNNERDTDRVSPQFTIGLEDNYIPVAPFGPETLSMLSQTGLGPTSP